MISGFILAKDEEKTIGAALRSLVSFCDEIIVVDTGSEDQTKNVARQFTDKIYDFAWIDDFSAARNFALSKCQGDWIIFLDADDEIFPGDQKKIKPLLRLISKDIAGFFLPYAYTEQRRLMIPRIFRKKIGLRFVMPVHEYLDIPDTLLPRFKSMSEITIFHHKKTTDNQSSIERNLRILENSVIKYSDNTHLQFFLGREYFNNQRYEQAIEIFQKLVRKTKNSSLLYNTYLHLGLSSQKLGQFDNALQYFQIARNHDSRFVEPLIYSANVQLYHFRNIIGAQKLYKQALQIPKPATTFPLQENFYYEFPKNQLQKIKNLRRPIALICGYYGQMNIGDELMLASIIQKLKNYRIIVASYSPILTQKLHNIESVPHKHQYFDLALHFAEVVIIGGGTLFHDQNLEKNKNIEYYCGIIQKAKKLGKKVFILGVGVDTIYLEKNRQFIQDTFSLCDRIEVRDRTSKERLLECGVTPEKINIIPDLVLTLQFPEFNTSIQKKKILGVNICLPILNSKHDLKKKIDEQLIPFLHKMKHHFELLFIPGHASDLKGLEYLEITIGQRIRCFNARPNFYFEDYFTAVSDCEILVASRYHLLLLGMILKKTTYALSYAEKTENLVKEYGGKIKILD